LTKADFWVCAGSKEGGNIVAKHFAYLLYSVTGNEQKALLDEKDPGECREDGVVFILHIKY
jgi:ETS-type family, other